MPIHDWTKVDAGIYHSFALSWLLALKRWLNQTLNPRSHYALQAPAFFTPSDAGYLDPGSDPEEAYIRRQQRVTVHAIPGDRVITTIELPEAGLKRNPAWLRTFALRLRSRIDQGVNCCILDVFPRTPAAPRGIHPLIWSPFAQTDFPLFPEQPFTVASYVGGPDPQAFIEPLALGDPLPDIPLFLAPKEYVSLPLEATYQAAWAEVPDRWREELEAPAGS